MKTMRNIKIWIVATLIGVAATTSAQTFHSGYFLESMLQRHEMNAAFGGEANYVLLPGVGGFQVGLQTNFGLSNYVFERDGQMVSALSSQVSAADFLKGLPTNQRINLSVEVPVLSVGFRGMGGFNTIVVKSRTMLDANIPSSLMAFVKTGQDPTTGVAHYDIDNMGLQANSYMEFALGHSRKLDALEGFSYGAKVKFLMGVANATLDMEHIGVDFSRNAWTISSQGTAQISNNIQIVTNEDGEIQRVDVNSVTGGFGMGIDLGAAYTPAALPDLTVSLAINDIGFISWDNMYQAVSAGEYSYTGFDNIGSDSEPIDKQIDDMLKSALDVVMLKDAGQKTTVKSLHSTLNVGAEYAILNRKISFGLLSSTRFAGEYTYAEGMAVVNFRPCHWFNVALNGSYSTYGGALGALFNFISPGFNLFFGCDYFAPTMKFNSNLIPVNPVNANFRIGLAIPFGIKR